MFSSFFIIWKWVSFIYWFSRNYTEIKISEIYSKLLKEKLENLGILGIKFGQYLCNRADISTKIMRNELMSFLNNNKTHSIEHTMELLNKSGIFKTRNVTLGRIIGSGSLTQVYECKLDNSDEKLVLKVKHPEVSKLHDEIYALKTITWFTSLVL